MTGLELFDSSDATIVLASKRGRKPGGDVLRKKRLRKKREKWLEGRRKEREGA